jgi:hypothetical protein
MAYFRIPPGRFEHRHWGFRVGDPRARRRLEEVLSSFLLGYRAALRGGEGGPLAARLDVVASESRGFAYEGAAMGLALRDALLPWGRRRVRAFLDDAGAGHTYMVHVGMGLALARVPWQRRCVVRRIEGLDPLLRWLVVDGYGFHEGYFLAGRAVGLQRRPDGLVGYAARAFDQGLGRSLWFVEEADVSRIARTIAAFPASRRPDLWSGVGLACAYAGGVDRPEVEALRECAGRCLPHVAQGAAFAAKARQRAGIPAWPTELACLVLCGRSADESARLADEALVGLAPDETCPAYEVWRRRLRARLFPEVPES